MFSYYRQIFTALYTVIKTLEVQKKKLSVWVWAIRDVLIESSPQGPAKRGAVCSQFRDDASQVCHSRGDWEGDQPSYSITFLWDPLNISLNDRSHLARYDFFLLWFPKIVHHIVLSYLTLQLFVYTMHLCLYPCWTENSWMQWLFFIYMYISARIQSQGKT